MLFPLTLLTERGRRRESSEAGVWAVAIVLGEKARQRPKARLVAPVRADVCPLALWCADEGLCFAIGLWAIGPCALQADTRGLGRGSERARAIVPAVVGERAAHRDAGMAKRAQDALEEAGCRLTTLIGKDLRVGVAAVPVDGDVGELIPEPGAAVRASAGLLEACAIRLPPPGGTPPKLSRRDARARPGRSVRCG